MSEDELMRPKEASKLLGVTYKTLIAWWKKGIIKGVKLPSGKMRYYKSSVMRIYRGEGVGVKTDRARIMTKSQRKQILDLVREVMAEKRMSVKELREKAKKELGIEPKREMLYSEAEKLIKWLQSLLGETD